MNKVTEKDEGSRQIFCGIDLHDQSLPAAIGIDKGAPYFRSYNPKVNPGARSKVKGMLDSLASDPGLRNLPGFFKILSSRPIRQQGSGSCGQPVLRLVLRSSVFRAKEEASPGSSILSAKEDDQ